MFLYFVASLVVYRLEDRPLRLGSFLERYRISPLRGKDWLWLLALLGSFAAISTLVLGLGPKLSAIPLLAPPASFPPELDPSKGALTAGVFMGLPLKGQWWVAAVYFMGWVFNILGEEFWFRGYMLPRQEAAYGKKAWVSHALVWALHHVWQGWTLVVLLPYSFLWCYLIQRGRNTLIPIAVHGLGNAIPLVAIVIGVIG